MGQIKLNKQSIPEEWQIVQQVEAADDIPKDIAKHGIVLVGPARKPTWMAFDCPCERGHRIMVNLDHSRWPYWKIWQRRPISISPSFDILTGDRRCHFVVQGGNVKWLVKWRIAKENCGLRFNKA
jgi:hypothetical protein